MKSSQPKIYTMPILRQKVQPEGYLATTHKTPYAKGSHGEANSISPGCTGPLRRGEAEEQEPQSDEEEEGPQERR